MTHTDAKTLERTLGFLIHDVARLMRRRFEQNARDLELTRSQWQAMAHLSNNEGIQQGALAKILEIEPITLTRIVDKLQASGLIERRPCPTDRRVWQLYLTKKAGPMLGEMKRIGAMTREEALDNVSKADRDQLIRTLTEMKINLIEALDRPADNKAANNTGDAKPADEKRALHV